MPTGAVMAAVMVKLEDTAVDMVALMAAMDTDRKDTDTESALLRPSPPLLPMPLLLLRLRLQGLRRP
jgi:hypothetical protein